MGILEIIISEFFESFYRRYPVWRFLCKIAGISPADQAKIAFSKGSWLLNTGNESHSHISMASCAMSGAVLSVLRLWSHLIIIPPYVWKQISLTERLHLYICLEIRSRCLPFVRHCAWVLRIWRWKKKKKPWAHVWKTEPETWGHIRAKSEGGRTLRLSPSLWLTGTWSGIPALSLRAASGQPCNSSAPRLPYPSGNSNAPRVTGCCKNWEKPTQQAHNKHLTSSLYFNK